MAKKTETTNQMPKAKKGKGGPAGQTGTRRKRQDVARATAVKLPEFDFKAQRRALQFLNRARTPAELAILPPRRIDEPRDLGPGRLAIHDEDEHQEKVKLLDIQNARSLFEARGHISPLWGFSHFDQIERLLKPEVLRNFGKTLSFQFSAATYGQWISGARSRSGARPLLLATPHSFARETSS